MSTQIAWHSLQPDEAIKTLTSDLTHGLSHNEALERLKRFGPNELPQPKTRTLSSIFLHQFLSPLIYILLAAAGIAFFIGEPRDSVIILIVVILNAVVGAYQEGRAQQSLEALRRLSKLKTRLLREGQEQIVEAGRIVPGDILILSSGDAVPADARLVEASTIAVAEAAMTGESLPVFKSTQKLAENTPLADRQNMVFAGTHVTAGRGLAVVTATGVRNEIGKIAHLATTTLQPKTQLELRIQQFGRYLIFAATVIFFVVIGLGLLREIPMAQIIMIAISQMVSLVPEGLPVAMTIALAVGVQRMARRGTVVRRLSAVETLGATTVICTDKTGTLTRNEMAVTAIYLPAGQREIAVTGVGYAPKGYFTERGSNFIPNVDKTLAKLFEASALCNDAQLLGPDTSSTDWKMIGDPTEGALLTLAAKGGLDPASIRNQFPRMAELPFDSDSKMMATQHTIEGKNVVFIKGAPEVILAISDSFYQDGGTQPLGEIQRAELQAAAKKMADSALRLLALGFVNDAHLDGSKGFSALSGKVTLIALVGELDPPREEVAASVRECQLAGIRPVMVTGDHKATGLAIAAALGISRHGDLAIDGQELDLLSDEALADKIDRISVFARVHPAQKLRIVEAYQKKGNVVAMTGDGVNDAPALVKANVGVAMGITGTEVAKEAAKIVITDDNFATIVAAVSEGRLVYQNLKKVILYLLTTSVAEVLVLLAALVSGFAPPLAAVQILWINLVTEGLITVNLIMDPLEGDEMKRPPVASNIPILSKDMLKRMLFLTPLMASVTFGWYAYRTLGGADEALVRSETFTLLAICQWFNVLNIRSATRSAFDLKVLRNKWLIGGMLAGNVLQALVIFWSPLGDLFHTTPIEFHQIFVLGAVGSLVLFTEEIRKAIVRRINKDKMQK
ncbi:MAG: HAD-IC family P-type ATPase [Deltaproteobacteria bacterium]|jgi:magnesium-transporting ATPase (P-type)|nr:HAD-IC family P-type ATPase [Deltaproteobacteria bacterium]